MATNDASMESGPEKNIGQWVNHPVYWYEDGSVVIRIEKSLYKVHFSQLIRLSEVMNDIFGIPDGKAPQDPLREGGELYPLYLDGVSKQEWEDFLAWVYRAEFVPVESDVHRERLYLSLLKLSAQWEISSGVAYAIAALETLVLPPVRRLELARMYTLRDWVEPAVRVILASPLSNLSEEELGQLGLKVYSLLVRAKEKMDMQLRWVAQVPPEMISDHSWQCTNNKGCAIAFKDFWWNKIGRKLLHPNVPIQYGGIPGLIQSSAGWNGLHAECKEEMEKKTREIVYPTHGIVAGVAVAIIAYYDKL